MNIHMHPCERCGSPTPNSRNLRVNIIADGGPGLIAVAGEICLSCVSDTVELAIQAPECASSGRWELYCYNTGSPVLGGTYGREPTVAEEQTSHVITDAERGSLATPIKAHGPDA